MWVADPDLVPGERQLLRRSANRAQGRLARGGALFLTDRRLIFRPHRFDEFLGAQRWELDLGEVRAVDVEPATGGWFDGGLRDRLRVQTRHGRNELFVTGDLPQIVEIIRSHLP